MLLQKRYNGKATYGDLSPKMPDNVNNNIRKRFMGFTAVAPGYGGYGPMMKPLGDYYNTMLEGQLRLTQDDQFAFVDPLMTTLSKTDSPLTNADTGAFNTIFGAQAIIQYTQNANALGSLPKSVWPQSGFRVVSAAPFSSTLGLAQSSDRPATEEPTYVEVSVTPVQIAKTFEISMILDMQSNTDDTVTYSVNKEVCQTAFMNAWDVDLLEDGTTDSIFKNQFDTLDRYTQNYTNGTAATWNGTYEMYWHSTRRSTTGYWDAQSYANGGTDRYLTRSHIDTLIYACAPYWASPADRGNKFFLTGPTTMPSIESLEEAKQFITTEKVSYGVNGISTNKGNDGGYVASAYKGMPIVFDQNVEKDTIARIYLIDTDYAGIVMGRPLEMVESSDPLVVGTNRLAMLLGIGQTWGTKPASSGSIRDLK